MTLEQQSPESSSQYDKLAVFRDFEAQTKTPLDELRWLANLRDYVEDPTRASWYDEKRGAEAPYNGYGSSEYENHLSNTAKDKLDEVAEKGTTYIARILAEQTLESPLSAVFDTRRVERSYNLPKPNREQLLSLLSEGRGLRDDHENIAFNRLLTKIDNQRPGVAEKIALDPKYEEYRDRGNVFNAEGRVWQLVYEMDEAAQRELIEPKTYEMLAAGEITRGAVDSEFEHKFLNRIDADYKDIQAAGLQYTPVQVAPGMVGFYEETGTLVKTFSVQDERAKPEPVDIPELAEAVFHDIDSQKAAEIAGCYRMTAGNLQTRFIVENALGLKLETVALKDQLSLCRLMLEATPSEMEHISKLKPESVVVAARSLEFGVDFSQSLRTIAKHAPQHETQEIFDMVGGFRESSRKIASWYRSYDPDLARDCELAMNERLTDALVATEVLARDGKLDIDTHPARRQEGYKSDERYRMKLNSLDEGIEILDALGKSLNLVHEVMTAEDVRVARSVEENVDFAIYRFISSEHGQALLRVRPQGGKRFDEHLEYGHSVNGAEATISFIVNPTNPHDYLDLYKDEQGVSVRFDREGRGVDESPFSQERDPTRVDGIMSLDLSAVGGDGRHMPVKIGRYIAAGNLLRADKVGSVESLNHIANHFNQEKYGSAEGFSKLAIYMMHMAEAMIAVQSRGSHASPYQSIPGYSRVA